LPEGKSNFSELDKNTTGILFAEWQIAGDDKIRFKTVNESTNDVLQFHDEGLLTCHNFKKTMNLSLDIVNQEFRNKKTGNFTWDIK